MAGTSNDIGLTFNGDVPATGGTYKLSAGTPAAETRRNADTTALARNQISMTALDGDWTLPRDHELVPPALVTPGPRRPADSVGPRP